MLKILTVLIALVVAAAGATIYRYGSLSPCVWLEKDAIAESGLPEVVVRTKIAAQFLLDGITDPTAEECLNAWWNFRVEELKEN